MTPDNILKSQGILELDWKQKKYVILITVIKDDSSSNLLSDPDARIPQFSVNMRLLDLSVCSVNRD